MEYTLHFFTSGNLDIGETPELNVQCLLTELLLHTTNTVPRLFLVEKRFHEEVWSEDITYAVD